ncbi:MAG TPA: cation diffusion facilitator family transporter [Acidimicrobiales bacterium]|nr:cation diffusion facilitator family transporter [Acidimicrobiales bacterium]
MTNHHRHHHGHDSTGGGRGAHQHDHADVPTRGLAWVWRWLVDLFGGHSHDHGDSRGDLEDSRQGMRALSISLGGLGVTALIQAAVVVVSGSVALLADTIHNVSDALTAIPLGVAFLLARRQPTRRYTYGYGRAEDLAGIFIVAVIALSAVVAAWQAVERLVDPREIHQAGWVAVAGLVGFLGNEAVAGYRLRVGRRIGSAALVADGLHARTDGLTSLAVLGAGLGSLAGWPLADPLIGLAISLAITRVLRIAARDIYRRLMDGVDPQIVDHITHQLTTTPGVRGIDRVRVRWIGHRLHVDADIVLDAHLPLTRAHDILEDARHSLLHHVPRLADALLHASPTHDTGPDPHALTHHHLATN